MIGCIQGQTFLISFVQMPCVAMEEASGGFMASVAFPLLPVHFAVMYVFYAAASPRVVSSAVHVSYADTQMSSNSWIA